MADRLSAPARALMLSEARTVVEMLAFLLSQPLLRRAPAGDGHPVVVMPGFLASDLSTVPLRAFLRARGYDARGWNAGRNLGRPGLEDDVLRELDLLWRRGGRKVSLVGWSLGGVYAREIARMVPEKVRQVITLGSPFTGDPRANHAWPIYERLSGRTLAEIERLAPRVRRTPPVPSTAIYSRTDGITAWQCCVQRPGPQRENVEVESSHLGYGHNPLVLYVIADRLAQPEGVWKPFACDGLLARLYPARRPPRAVRRRLPVPARRSR